MNHVPSHVLSPVTDRAGKAARSSCGGWKKLCYAIQPERHLSDCGYRLLLHFAPFSHVQLLSWPLRTVTWNLHRNDANSQINNLGGETTAVFGNAPFLEATEISKNVRRPSQFLGAPPSYRSAFFKTKRSSLSHNISSDSACWVSVAELTTSLG